MQDLDSWVATGLSPNQTLESVFGVPDSFGLDNKILIQALSFNGGSGTKGAARTLLPTAVTALLSSTHPDMDYPLTTAQVISDVHAALTTLARKIMLNLLQSFMHSTI